LPPALGKVRALFSICTGEFYYDPSQVVTRTGVQAMNLKRPPRKHKRPLEVLDTVMDSYVHWRDESRAVADSYRNWHVAGGGERDAAFARYLEALEREEHAALGYRRVVEQSHAPRTGQR
jgi:hypothetical protein